MLSLRLALIATTLLAGTGCTTPAPDERETPAGVAPGATTTPPQQAVPADAVDTTSHFTADSASYTLRWKPPLWTASVGYHFRNPVNDTLYVLNCNGAIVMGLQKRTATGWDDVWLGASNACMSPPIIIPPGGETAGRIDVHGAEPGNASTTTFRTADLDGTYRLVWYQPYVDFDPARPASATPLPLAQRVSAPFRMSTAPQ